VASNKTAGLKLALSNLSTHFSSTQQWTLDSCTSSILKMSQRSIENIHHHLLIIESPAATGRPPAGLAAINCILMVTFVELEDLIDGCFHRDPNMAAVSQSIWLKDVGSPAHIYNNEYYTIGILPDGEGNATRQFLNDYDDFLEPVRFRLDTYKVFLDDNYLPPGTSLWPWSLRRLAHAKLYGDANRWKAVSNEIASKARVTLDESSGENHKHPRIFTSIEALNLHGERRGAQEVLDLITFLQD
jgi:hypothetical protein